MQETIKHYVILVQVPQPQLIGSENGIKGCTIIVLSSLLLNCAEIYFLLIVVEMKLVNSIKYFLAEPNSSILNLLHEIWFRTLSYSFLSSEILLLSSVDASRRTTPPQLVFAFIWVGCRDAGIFYIPALFDSNVFFWYMCFFPQSQSFPRKKIDDAAFPPPNAPKSSPGFAPCLHPANQGPILICAISEFNRSTTMIIILLFFCLFHHQRFSLSWDVPIGFPIFLPLTFSPRRWNVIDNVVKTSNACNNFTVFLNRVISSHHALSNLGTHQNNNKSPE